MNRTSWKKRVNIIALLAGLFLVVLIEPTTPIYADGDAETEQTDGSVDEGDNVPETVEGNELEIEGGIGEYEGFIEENVQEDVTVETVETSDFIENDITDDKTNDVIEIYTADDLYDIRDNLSGNYKLMNDIDLSKATAYGGLYDYNGCGWNPIGSNNKYSNTPFTGVFDGQGYTISGMSIDISNNNYINYYVALFARNEGEIKNLNINNSHINISTSNGVHNVYAAFIAAENNGVIEGVHVLGGTVSVSNIHGDYKERKNHPFSTYAASISAYNQDGIITDCSNDADVLVHATGFMYYYWDSINFKKFYYYAIPSRYASGITNYGSVIKCYNYGSVKSDKSDNNGEASGYSYAFAISYGAAIKESYCKSMVSLGDDTKTMLYYVGGEPNKYYYLYGANYDAIGSDWIGLNDNQMQNSKFFEGFDFENVWGFSDKLDYKYPMLKSSIDEEIVKYFANAVNGLPNVSDVTLDDASVIGEARSIYESLTDSQKGLVDESILQKLIDVETALSVLQEIVQKEAEDEAEASKVIDMIESLPNASSITLDDIKLIEEARNSYEKLTIDQKKYVSDDLLKKLEDAELTITEIQEVETNKKELKWKNDSVGWWVEDSSGWYPRSQWQQIKGVWYYFDSNGYMAYNEYRGGCWLRSDGSWNGKSGAKWVKDSKGWWYSDNGWYPNNQWLKINGIYYYFDNSGYMAHDEYRGGCWLRSDGSWNGKSGAKWVKDSKGWWYNDNGWYPKNQTVKIDGINYRFNSSGYLYN